jgi:hypothetical protein
MYKVFQVLEKINILYGSIIVCLGENHCVYQLAKILIHKPGSSSGLENIFPFLAAKFKN